MNENNYVKKQMNSSIPSMITATLVSFLIVVLHLFNDINSNNKSIVINIVIILVGLLIGYVIGDIYDKYF